MFDFSFTQFVADELEVRIKDITKDLEEVKEM